MQNGKRRFSDSEFDIMVEQLTVQKPASFEMLCEIAEKTLHGWIIKSCRESRVLCDKGLEEDIYHDVQVKLICKTVTDFLLREDTDGVVNRDPDGFKSWMFRVAGNLIKDAEKKEARKDARCREFLEGEESKIPGEEGDSPYEQREREEKLRSAVAVVLESRSEPYIVLTWLAMSLFVLELDVEKIRSNHLFLEFFFDKSLYEMFDMLTSASKRIPWLVITESQKCRIMEKLNRPVHGDKKYGELHYREFFMKKEPLSAISDWENRMNSLIKRVMGNEASFSKRNN